MDIEFLGSEKYGCTLHLALPVRKRQGFHVVPGFRVRDEWTQSSSFGDFMRHCVLHKVFLLVLAQQELVFLKQDQDSELGSCLIMCGTKIEEDIIEKKK